MRSSRPMYPAYRDRRPRAHTLAYDTGTLLITEDGETFEPESYELWKQTAISLRLDVIVDDVATWRFRTDAIYDGQASVNCVQNKLDKQARVTSITFRQGNKWAKLIDGKAWGGGDLATLVREIRATCDQLGVGTQSTPAALGQAVMRKLVEGRHTTPSLACCRDLRGNAVGGRADVFVPDANLDRAYEQDRRGAYCAEALHPLPVGTACRIARWEGLEALDDYATWFCECDIELTKDVAIGPFPVRIGEKKVVYPTESGTYRGVWIWKEEAVEIEQAGGIVTVKQGWGWLRLEPVLRNWAQAMFRAREQATPETERHVKAGTVAAIGWHAMAPRSQRIVTLEEHPDIAPVILVDGTITGYGVLEAACPKQSCMPQWSSYIWMRARITLYRRMLAEVEAGNMVIMSNYDSIMTLQPTKLELKPGLGEWREYKLTDVLVIDSRSILSAEKVWLPGRTGANRKEVVETLRKRLTGAKTGCTI